jgi:hypothetical protein
MNAVEIATEQSGNVHLSPHRRAYLLAHPEDSTAAIATALGVPPFTVQQWRSRPDILKPQAESFKVTAPRRVQDAAAASSPAPALPPTPRSVPELAGVHAEGDTPIFTPELRAALVRKVKGIVAAAAADQARLSVREILRGEVRALVFEAVRQAFAEIVDALDAESEASA